MEGIRPISSAEESEVTMKTNTQSHHLFNEKGVAIVAVLLLSLIALGITASLLYMVTQGTRSSGFFKRYQSARDAGVGGSELTRALIQNLGKLTIPTLKGKDGIADCVDFASQCDCGLAEVVGDNTPTGTVSGVNYDCLCAKICDPTSAWAGKCSYNPDPTANPSALDATVDFDIQCKLPGISGKEYLVSSKIVDTILGNSDMSGGSGLEGSGVVDNTLGSKYFSPPLTPYLYRVEVDSRDKSTAVEKSRWAMLYAY